MKPLISLVLVVVCGLAGCERNPASSPPPASTAAPATPPAAAPVIEPPHTDALLTARQLRLAGKLADARAALQPAAEASNASDAVVELLGEIDIQILFTPSPAPEKVDYTIVGGKVMYQSEARK